MSRSLRVFVVEQLWHANRENTSGRMNKSINLNHLGNIESFGSWINSTLSVEVVEGSINLFTFVRSWLVSTSFYIIASSITTGFEVIFSLYWDSFSFWNTFVQRPKSPWVLIRLVLSIFNKDLQIVHSHSFRITALQLV